MDPIAVFGCGVLVGTQDGRVVTETMAIAHWIEHTYNRRRRQRRQQCG